VGTTYKDFTAIGPVVNLTSRLQSAAGIGEVIITQEVFDQVQCKLPDAQRRELTLKGIDIPVTAYALKS
jgi:adenylate cyclase